MFKRASARFMLTYVVYFACLLLVLIPAHAKTFDLFTANILQDSDDQMVEGILALEADINDMTTLAQSFYSSTRFSSLSYLRPPYTALEIYAMEQARLELLRYVRTLSMVLDCGIVYGNGIVLTPLRVYTSLEGFYGDFFRCGALSAGDWTARLRSASYDGLLAVMDHYSYDHGNYSALTLARTLPLASDIGAKTLVFANFEAASVLDRIVKPELLGDGLLRLYDCGGRLLALSGSEDPGVETMQVLAYESGTSGLRAELALPSSLVARRLAPLTRLYCLYGTLVAGIGLALSVFFAYHNSKPVRDIVASLDGKALPPSLGPGAQGEFGLIQASIRHLDRSLCQAQDDLLRQEQVIRSNAVLRLMHGLIYTDKEWREARAMLADFPPAYRLCHVRTGPEEAADPAHGVLIAQTLCRCFPKALVFPLSEPEHVVIVPVDGGGTEELRQAILEARQALRAVRGGEARFAVSSPQQALESLAEAYAQTSHLFRLYGNAEDRAVCFKDDLPRGAAWMPLEFSESERFYRLLLACEREAALSLLEKTREAIKGCGYADDLYVQQAYLSIVLVLRRIQREFFQDLPLDLPSYSARASLDDLFGQIRLASLCVCARFEQAAAEQSQALTTRILEYVDANLSDPDMHARSVAACFDLSEGALQKHVRAATGKTFYEYLDGQRMALAVALLKTSTLSVQEIAARTGFLSHNSFYKAFRRSQGLPPSALR